MRTFATIAVFIVFFAGLPTGQAGVPYAVAQEAFNYAAPEGSPAALIPGDDLKAKINEKATILEAIEAQKAVIEQNLEEVEGSANTLKNEVRGIDTNIRQLDLTIQSNEVTIEKLGFELQWLTEEIPHIEDNIVNAKLTMKKLFVELQERERENLLVLFLRNQSLSDSVGELQTITALNNRLTVQIAEFRELQKLLANRINETVYTKTRTQVAQVNLASRQVIAAEVKSEKERLLEVTKSEEERYQRQLDQLKALQFEISKEIDAYETELRRTIDKNLLPIPRPGVLALPVNIGARTPGKQLTQKYGRTLFAIRNYGSQFHNGIDIGMPIGTEVFAAEKGTIINVGNQDAYRGCYRAGYGRFVVIKHENGLTTLSAHLSKYIVKVGDTVERGQVVGYVGRTGWATGPHLHFTVFATQTITPARGNLPEGAIASRSCGPMPVGGDMDPLQFLDI
ncbi:MAG: peptidoglycan DD-metalloendopeptidase family protein [Candidatus Jorgensenbacteria bacterium]|nr:peptidoglycan DD-metalloendopeptidase family protein [Candidatus Jorgensenbacteria bacterium]